MGRALRRHGDTDTATVIVPALVPDGSEDGEAGLEATGAATRHVLERRPRDVRPRRPTSPRPSAPPAPRRAANPDGQPAGCRPRSPLSAPPGILQATLDALRIHVLDKTTSSWWDGYGHARAYHQQHGNLDVPHAYVTAGGYPLGTWLSAQRAERNSGALTAERIRLLDELGMIWDLLEDAWMSAYRELRAFSDAHGHLEVPLDYVDRRRHQPQPGGRAPSGTPTAPGRLTPARRALLEAIGFTLEPEEGPVDPPLPAARRRHHPARRPRQAAPRLG